MTVENIVEQITAHYVDSGKKGWFNGIPVKAFLSEFEDEASLRAAIADHVRQERITLTFASVSINPHIKRLPDASVEKQLEWLASEPIKGICAYPSRCEIQGYVDSALNSGVLQYPRTCTWPARRS